MIKRWPCPDCGYTFSDDDLLTLHQENRHEGPKPVRGVVTPERGHCAFCGNVIDNPSPRQMYCVPVRGEAPCRMKAYMERNKKPGGIGNSNAT